MTSGPAEDDLGFSRLGFGCASLVARQTPKESLRTLHAAHAAGLTHVDVARSYGYGEAESVVGAFLRTRPAGVTVATKLGIVPPKRTTALAAAKSVARRAARLSPRLRRRLRSRASSMVSSGQFSVAEARASFEDSSRELGLERVDLLLLHDCRPEDLDEGLGELIETWVADGRVGRFGIATELASALTIREHQPAFASVVQIPDPVVGPPLPDGLPRALLTHSVLGAQRVLSEDGLRANESTRIDLDLDQEGQLGRLLVAAALRRNPHGTVLTSSRQPARIAANASVLYNPPEPALVDAFLAIFGATDVGQAPQRARSAADPR